jgi:acyl-CoA reductase-like NAD-dependent aldehyde dehydrogenase
VCDIIEDTRRNGHRFLLGGDVREQPGYFVPITLVDNPPEDARCVAEEAFGPILPVLKYSDIDEVLRRANASRYGLAASVWGRDEQAAEAVARRIESGVVWVNCIHVLSPHVAMGGMKESGLGVENGVQGLSHYCNTQTVVHAARLS